MWNNDRLLARAFILLLPSLVSLASGSEMLARAQESHSPKLLLSAQRLRRLQRDRQRQTPRWNNFESRVKSVPDSRERGFELALYYAVTQDEQTGKDAEAWAQTHACERRQVALVMDWVGVLLAKAHCTLSNDAQGLRDTLFLKVAAGEDTDEFVNESGKRILSDLQSGGWRDAGKLYAALEYLYVARSVEHVDLRQDAEAFFSELPAALLLSQRPRQLDAPDWRTHIAALALVGLDPNLRGSQFLQGWAIEDRHTLGEGEGVAYEFLWADPYLPGVGYENLEQWLYDADGTLYARTDWNDNACWVHVTPSRIEQESCPAGWKQRPMSFGNMTLIPLSGACAQLPEMRKKDDAVILSTLPYKKLYFDINEELNTAVADASGMWKSPPNTQGPVCTSPDTLRIPKARKPARN
jgi:hypothetical protein